MEAKIFLWWMAAVLLPAGVACPAAGIPREGDHDEAVLLFTSGSSGDPKGVVLSHRNLVGNVSQFRVMLDATTDDLILASLPFFHSFGCTVTLWFPLIEGVRIVTYPIRSRPRKCAELDRAPSSHARAGRADFSARLSAQGGAGANARVCAYDHRRGETAAQSGRGFRGALRQRSFRGLRPDGDFSGRERESARPEPAARRPVQPSQSPGSVGKIAPGSRRKSATPRRTRSFRCTTPACSGCAGRTFSRAISTIPNARRKCCRMVG